MRRLLTWLWLDPCRFGYHDTIQKGPWEHYVYGVSPLGCLEFYSRCNCLCRKCGMIWRRNQAYDIGGVFIGFYPDLYLTSKPGEPPTSPWAIYFDE